MFVGPRPTGELTALSQTTLLHWEGEGKGEEGLEGRVRGARRGKRKEWQGREEKGAGGEGQVGMEGNRMRKGEGKEFD